MMMYLYLNFFSRILSFMMSSYVVSSTLKRHGAAPSPISLSQIAWGEGEGKG